MFNTNLTAIAASLVATAALLVFLWAARGPRERALLGPAADGWELLRGAVLPALDRLLRRRAPGKLYAAYTLSLTELVGMIDASPEEVEQMLWEAGFRRMPLAAYKTLPIPYAGRGEVGSWAYRDGLLASRQVHVMLFAAGEGRTLVAAHEEANALNPFTALEHYRGGGYSPSRGQKQVQTLLPDEVW